MKTRSGFVDAVAGLALGACLALASPGVQIARADSADSADETRVRSSNVAQSAHDVSQAGASCTERRPGSSPLVATDTFEELRRQIAARAEASRSAQISAEGVVSLNTRGFDYSPEANPGLDIRAVLIERQGR